MELPRCYYRIYQWKVIRPDAAPEVHVPTFCKECTNLEAERAMLQTLHRGKIIFVYESIPYGSKS